MQNAEPLENLADQFARFPGIGRKGAVRMAYEVMSMSNEQAMELAKAIENAKVKLHRCRLCQDYTANEVCSICASPKRDRSVICVVESPRDVKAIERTHEFNGLYHVLHGLISPMDGIGADQLCVKELLARLDGTVKEVIMATSLPWRARPPPCTWPSSSSPWASKPPALPMACRLVPAWNTLMKPLCTALWKAAAKCDARFGLTKRFYCVILYTP